MSDGPRERLTDEDVLKREAAKHGFIWPEQVEAFRGTAAFRMALVSERLGDIGRALMNGLRL